MGYLLATLVTWRFCRPLIWPTATLRYFQDARDHIHRTAQTACAVVNGNGKPVGPGDHRTAAKAGIVEEATYLRLHSSVVHGGLSSRCGHGAAILGWPALGSCVTDNENNLEVCRLEPAHYGAGSRLHSSWVLIRPTGRRQTRKPWRCWKPLPKIHAVRWWWALKTA